MKQNTYFSRNECKENTHDLALKQRLLNEKLITFSARKINLASKHLINQLVEEIEHLYWYMKLLKDRRWKQIYLILK